MHSEIIQTVFGRKNKKAQTGQPYGRESFYYINNYINLLEIRKKEKK
jgi:hypothetical protein